MKAVPATDAPKYYPDDDARTIIRVQEVLQDPKRKNAAVAELKKQVDAANAAMAHTKAVGEVKAQIKSVFGGK
jgi:hypothetical protein